SPPSRAFQNDSPNAMTLVWLAALSSALIVRPRRQANEVAAGERSARRAVGGESLPHVDEGRRVRHVEVHGAERPLDAEHRRSRADAEREREDGGGGECRARGELAQPVAQIVDEVVEQKVSGAR